MGANIKAEIKVTRTHHLTDTPFPTPPPPYNFPKFEIDVFSIFFSLDLGQLRVSQLGLDPKLTLR